MDWQKTHLAGSVLLVVLAVVFGAVLLGELIVLPALALLALVLVIAIAVTRSRRVHP
jgi:hypothetical protein